MVMTTPMPEERKFSTFREFGRRIIRDRLGLVGLILVVGMVMSAVCADWIVTHDPLALDLLERLEAPSIRHYLGTDQMGRDVFSRVILGGRIALKVALLSISGALAIGLVLGLLAGYGPRWLDNVLLLLFDTLRSFPTTMFALAVVTVFGPSLETVILIVVATSIPVYGRMVRTQTQALRNHEFILAERAMGAGMFRVIFHHLLPNVIGPILIVACMDIPVVVTTEAGLSFLGLGVRPPTPSWGSILNDGYSFIRNTPWLVIAGGLPLVLTTLGFTFLGEALRDIFDPKLHKDR